MATISSNYTDDGSAIVAPQALTAGNLIRGTYDASSVESVRIVAMLGRGGTTALTNKGVQVVVRAMLNGGGIIVPRASYSSTLTAAYAKQVNNGAGYAIGTSTFSVDGVGTCACNDILCFWGFTAVQANATSLPNLEFLRVSKASGGPPSTSITVDSPCRVAKIDNEMFTNQADVWDLTLPGGVTYEVIFDYDATSAGEAVAVVAYRQTLDSYNAA